MSWAPARTAGGVIAPGPQRLTSEVAELAARGVTSLPESLGVAGLERWYPQFVMVLEGAAAAARGPAAAAGCLRGRGAAGAGVVRAPGSGDDEIARLAADLPGDRLVMTADRELRARCEAAGAAVTGPRWLLDLL